jgi:hypothetical protein
MTTYFRFGSRGGQAKLASNPTGHAGARPRARPGALTASRLKVTATLDPAELASISV